MTVQTDLLDQLQSRIEESNKRVKLEDENRGGYDLPEELLAEIFIRLPLKSIFKFKCVSRTWNSFVSVTPLWAWTLLNYDDRYQNNIPNQYLNRSYVSTYSPEEIVKFFIVQQKHQDHPKGRYNYKALGSSDGLLLCSLPEDSVYYICNPLTQQQIRIPPDDPGYDYLPCIGFVTKIDQGGKLLSYKVVKLLGCYNTSNLHARIFASETGKWSHCTLVSPRRFSILFHKRRPFSLNGSMHFYCTDATNEVVIFAYDPYKTPYQCRFIELPVKRDVRHDTNELCEASEGRLQYFDINADSKVVRLWVLEDYDNGTWDLKHNINLYDITSIGGLAPSLDEIYPIAFHPFNSNIVYWRWKRNKHTAIFSYDIRSKMLKLVFDDLDSTWIKLRGYSARPILLKPWKL